MAQPHLFVSYSRVDRWFAERVVNRLRRAYNHVWFDESLHGGQDWWAEILKQIDACDIFIYLMSRDSLDSPYCQTEYEEARRLHKQILPVLIRARTDIPGELKRLLYVDMSSGPSANSVELIAALNRLSDALAAAPPPPPTALQPLPMPAVPDKPKTLWGKFTLAMRRPEWSGIGVIETMFFGIAMLILAILTLIAMLNSPTGGPSQTPTGTNTSVAAAPTKIDTATLLPTVTQTQVPTATDTFTSMFTPTPAPGTKRTDSHGVAQVYVPAGCFMMGSDPAKDSQAKDDEQPQHQVCITQGYWIDTYEVTNAAYQQFVDAGGYTRRDYWSDEGWSWKGTSTAPVDCGSPFDKPQQPRSCVTWYEAEAYAKWRGGRLPTEAEWEYAARGPESLIYPWGNTWDATILNWSPSATTPVGSYEGGKSWVGVYDMVGNVWEWVADWYGGMYYHQEVKNDPTGVGDGLDRVLRGGSWFLAQYYGARAAYRAFNDPGSRDVSDLSGVRVLVGVRPPSP